MADTCCDGARGADNISSLADETGTIQLDTGERLVVPTATETAKGLVAEVMSMLGWDHSKLSQTEDAVRRYILTQYPLQGRAPSCREIEEALGPAGTEVQTILRRLHELDILYLEPECLEIRLAYPFSSVPTRHVVKFEDWPEAKPVYAPCAVDALGIPFMFDHDLSVASSCAHCSKPITLDVRNRMIVTHKPTETVVWAGATRTGPAATSVCPAINFFCSSDHVAAWLQGRTDTTGAIISLAEAFHIGKAIFEPLLIRELGSASHATEKAGTVPTERAAMTATSMGGLVAAFLASVCCIGPLVFAALGVGIGGTGLLASTAGFLKGLLPYRPGFIGLTVLLLGVSFYLACRKPTSACAPGAICAPRETTRASRVLLWVVTAIALVLVLAPYWLGV